MVGQLFKSNTHLSASNMSILLLKKVKYRNNTKKLTVKVSRIIFFVIITNQKLTGRPGLTIFFPLYLANGLFSDYGVSVKFAKILMLFQFISFLCFCDIKNFVD